MIACFVYALPAIDRSLERLQVLGGPKPILRWDGKNVDLYIELFIFCIEIFGICTEMFGFSIENVGFCSDQPKDDRAASLNAQVLRGSKSRPAARGVREPHPSSELQSKKPNFPRFVCIANAEIMENCP